MDVFIMSSSDTSDPAGDPAPVSVFTPKKWWFLVFVIFGLGSIIGLCSAGLSFLLEFIQQYILGAAESLHDPTPFGSPWWRRLASAACISVFAAVIWWLIRRRSRIPSVSGAVHGAPMPAGRTLIHVLTQIIIVGAGMSVGRETAPRELGAMLGQKLSQRFRLSRNDMAVIIAVGAGAGFAGVYNAPLTGMFFAVEVLLTDTDIIVAATALGTSAVAAFIGGLLKGTSVFYSVTGLTVSWQIILFAVVLGPVAGICGYIFRLLTQWANTNSERTSRILWMLPLAGLLTGVAAVWLPQVMGNGRAMAQTAYNSVSITVIPLLLILIAAKTSLTVLTIQSGASGGVLTPAVAVGGAIGAIAGIGWAYLFPNVTAGACAFIVSAAFLAASQKAPLMASVFMLEITHASISFIIPVGIAVSLSMLVSSWLPSSRLHRLCRAEAAGKEGLLPGSGSAAEAPAAIRDQQA